MNRFIYVALAGLTLAACSGEEKEQHESGEKTSATSTTTAPAQVASTGKIITVELYTDEKGNYFKPNKFEVHRGDMIRFTLVGGVHNVHFLPDSNPGAKNLPPASEFLQLPGQTWDYLVSLEPGHYYFQCDPHALLGMVGHIEVEDEK